jgi:hypothetical protein
MTGACIFAPQNPIVEMKKNAIFLAVSIASIVFASCAGNEQKPQATPTTQEAPKSNKEKLEELRQKVMKEVDYTSVVTYLQTTREYGNWGALLKKSKWGKDLHNGYFTILVPEPGIIEKKLDLLAEFKRDDNQALLDKFMARHIVKNPFTAAKAEGMRDMEMMDGSKLKIQPGVQQIEHISYSTDQIGTDHGSIVLINGMIDFPEKELQKSTNIAVAANRPAAQRKLKLRKNRSNSKVLAHFCSNGKNGFARTSIAHGCFQLKYFAT